MNRRRSRSSSGMSSTAKTDIPRSGRPSSARARAVRPAWRRSLSTVSGPPRMRGVAAAGGCSFRSRARCSIRSTGTRSGLVSPLRTVLLPAGLGLAACPSHGASLRCRAAYRQRRAEDPYRPAKLMADAIRRIIQLGNIVGGHHYSINASVSPLKSMTPVSTPKSGRSVIPSPGMHQRVPAETACEILHKALPRKRYGPGPVGHACPSLSRGAP